MGIISDHAITKTLKDGNLRNDPEVLDLICDVLNSWDEDMDKAGVLVVSPATDKNLEMLAAAIDRAENAPEDEDEDDLDEDEDFIDEDDEDIIEDDEDEEVEG